MSVLIDSGIVLEILRARDQAIIAQWSVLAASSSPIMVSPITFAEIGAGALAGEMPAIARLFGPLACVDLNAKIGELAGKYLRQYGKSHNVKIADALIAASAVHSQAALWTRNRKHYPMPDVSFYV